MIFRFNHSPDMKPDLTQASLCRFLRELYLLRDEASLTRFLLENLPGVVRYENVLVGRHHPGSRQAFQLNLLEPFSTPNFLQMVNQSGAAADHPIWKIEPGVPKCLSSIMSRDRWHAHPLYCDFLRRDKVEDHLTLDLPGAAGTFTMIGLLRERRGFRDIEQETMSLLSRHLRQAFDNARLFEKALNAKEQIPGAGLLAHRHYFADTSELVRLVREHRNRWAACVGSDQPIQPNSLRDWAAKQIDWLRRGLVDSATTSYQMEGLEGTVVFRVARNWTGNGFFLLETHDNQASRRLGLLTPRERQVLDVLGTGRGDAEIGQILGLSHHTVKGHLKSIYRKLGVSNRVQASRVRAPPSFG